jgi:methyl-accepting chemotaxis protein
MGVIAATGLAVFFLHRIAGPLYRIERDLEERVGGGDFTVKFVVRKGDEMVELVKSINNMIEKLSFKMGKILRVSEELTSLSQKEAPVEKFAELSRKLEGAVREFKL